MKSFVILLSAFLGSLSAEAAPQGSVSRGNAFNPDMSLNSLFLYRRSNRGNTNFVEERNGFAVQELELQLTADVDPYARFVGILSVHPEVTIDTAATPPTRSDEYHVGPEEAYAESLGLPNVTLKVGKFKTAFGRHNTLHTHAFPFIDAPLVNTELLGEEGFNDVGASASYLLPLPWFSELTAQVVSGKSEEVTYFNSTSPNDVAPVARLRNLWDLSDALTLDLGISGARGENAEERGTNFLGTDLTFKWRPTVGGKERSLVWSSEFIMRNMNRVDFAERGRGVYTYLQYQFAQRWWVQGRQEYLKIEHGPAAPNPPEEPLRNKRSFLVGYVPSEFSSIRLQYDWLRDSQAKNEQRFTLQMNFSIGAHPAHAY